MGLTSVLKPDGFRPIGAGRLLYTFTEASISGKPNYRVEIELNGLTDIPIISYYPNSDLEISCDIAPLLRTALLLSTDPAERLGNTYVKYQAKWDGGSDSQVPLSSNVIYYYVGNDNYLNHRTQFEITTSGGEFLLSDSSLSVWANRTAYVDFLNGLGVPWILTSPASESWFGSESKKLESAPLVFTNNATLSLSRLSWVLGTTTNETWISIAYGAGLFVAVSGSGKVMTSPDGATWTLRTAAVANQWSAVCYGGGLFVAVSISGSGNRVMTSPDGITWTSRTSAANNDWQSVTYGNGLFVAVSSTGTGNRVMTSPTGVTWTIRTSAADNYWFRVTYGGGLFVAVSISGSGNRVMTSPDGTTWTSRTSAADNDWAGVAYSESLGLYAAISNTASVTSVMTSPDAITWTLVTTTGSIQWIDLIYANGLFIGIPDSGSTSLLISRDGVTWSTMTGVASNSWKNIAFSGTRFVAIGNGANGAFYSYASSLYASLSIILREECANPVYLRWINDYGGLATWLFDQDQLYSVAPDEDGRFKKLGIVARTLTMEQWLALQELNRNGAEYGDNEKLGAFVQDFTDEDDPINIFVESQEASTQTKLPRHEFGITLRYPLIDNSDI